VYNLTNVERSIKIINEAMEGRLQDYPASIGWRPFLYLDADLRKSTPIIPSCIEHRARAPLWVLLQKTTSTLYPWQTAGGEDCNLLHKAKRMLLNSLAGYMLFIGKAIVPDA
jgi:hypothetical protein